MKKIMLGCLSVLLFMSQPVLAKPDWQIIGVALLDGDEVYYIDPKLTDLATTDSRKKFRMLIDTDVTFGGMTDVFEEKIRIRSCLMNGEVNCAAGSFNLFSGAMYGERFATGELLKDTRFEVGEYETTELDSDDHIRVIYDYLCGKTAKK